jgi:hypothetical protein
MSRQSLGRARRKASLLDRPLLVDTRSAHLVTSANVNLVGSQICLTNIDRTNPLRG